jgi:D-beta-D-heptose 7-phosphate kinase/D-beta-D-heptose 1-phosphate adenosyltransferase
MMNLAKIIDKFPKAKILVIGDLILDQYIFGEVDRVSPEAPVPVVWAKKRNYVPGGAANVANNISSFDAKVFLAGVIGKDLHADILLKELGKRKINTKGIFRDAKRHTTLKTRIVAGHQQVVRVDWEDRHPISSQATDKIINFLKNNIDSFDAVIVEDYGKGVINPKVLSKLISIASSNNKIIAVDPKEEHFQYYRGVTTITPNRKELENAVRNLKLKDTTNSFKINTDKLFSDQDIDEAAREVVAYLNLDSLLVTLGERGMKLFDKNGRLGYIPTVAQEVFDVSGAGDTVIAVFTLALASQAKKIEAAYLANFAAGIVVGKLGTAVTNRSELKKRIRKN